MRGPKLPENKTKQILYTGVAAALFIMVLAIFFYNIFQRSQHPLKYEAEVERWSTHFEVDPMLVYAVIKTESSFNAEAVSSVGARGLMQMTEETFDWIKQKIAPDEPLTFDDLFDPDVSVRFGACLLSLSLQRYGGDVSTTAAAYHSGWGTVDRLLEDDECTDDHTTLTKFPYNNMSHYVNKIDRNYRQYTRLYAD